MNMSAMAGRLIDIHSYTQLFQCNTDLTLVGDSCSNVQSEPLQSNLHVAAAAAQQSRDCGGSAQGRRVRTCAVISAVIRSS
jgi:hypothetical protein